MIYAPVLANLSKKSKPGLTEGIFFFFPDLTAHFRLAGKCSKMVGSSWFTGQNAKKGPKFFKDHFVLWKMHQFCKILERSQNRVLRKSFFSLFPIWQPILDWLGNGQKRSDLRDLKAKMSQIVRIFI